MSTNTVETTKLPQETTSIKKTNSIGHFACRGKGCNSLILTYQKDPLKLCDRCIMRQDEHDTLEKIDNNDNNK